MAVGGNLPDRKIEERYGKFFYPKIE